MDVFVGRIVLVGAAWALVGFATVAFAQDVVEGSGESVLAEGSAEPDISLVPIDETGPGAFREFLYFLGRFHPIVLHFPIGLLVALFLLEVITFFRPTQGEPAKTLLLVLGAASATVAAVFGLFLSWSASFDSDLVFWHQWTGIGVAVTAVLAGVSRWRMIVTRRRGYATGYAVLLFVSVGVLVPAGHYGAALTHGPRYLTTYLPESLSFLGPLLGEVRDESAMDFGEGAFAREIVPILEAKCLECHSGGKQDGDLSLESLEYAMAGGESGNAAIVPGDAAGSYMIELLLLPETHGDVMPPEGETPLEAGELVALARWINEGAVWGDVEFSVAAAEVTVGDDGGGDGESERGAEGASVDGVAVAAQILNTEELMKLFFEPPFEALQAGLVEEPSGRSAMKSVYNSAVALAEAHNLLYSRVGEDFMATAEWARHTMLGREASQEIGDAMQERDYARMKAGFSALVISCNECHEVFELDVDEVTVAPEEKEERRRR